ncbi:MAG: hypothetical protein ACOH5I_19675 [Oligoflexus sp.]
MEKYKNSNELTVSLKSVVFFLAIIFIFGCGSEKEEGVFPPPEVNQPNLTITDEEDVDPEEIVSDKDPVDCVDSVDCEVIDSESEEKDANETTKGFMEVFDSTEEEISILANLFDSRYAAFNHLFEDRAEAVSEAESILSDLQVRMYENQEKWLVLKDLKAEWKDKLLPKTDALCNDLSLKHALTNARSQISYMNDLLASLEEKHAALSYSPRFANLKDDLKTKLGSLFLDYTESLLFILDDSYDSKVEAPTICEDANKAWNDLVILGTRAEAIYQAERAAAIAEELRRMLAEIEAEATASRLANEAILKVKGLDSRLTQLIYQGRVSEARELVGVIFDEIDQLITESGLSADSKQMKELLGEVEKIKPSIVREANRVKDLSSARGVLNYRRNAVRNLLLRCELKSMHDADFKSFWDVRQVEIYKALNTSPRQKIPVPVFNDWDELYQYEVLLDQMEDILRQIAEDYDF